MSITSYILAQTVTNEKFMPAFTDESKIYQWDWQKIATVDKARFAQEEVFGYTGLPAAQATEEGGPGFYADISELDPTTITIGDYTLGVVLTDNVVQDSVHITSLASKLGKMAGRSHAYTVSYSVAQAFNRAFNSSYPLFDGVELCGTHTLKDGSTVSNKAATVGPINFTNLWLALSYFLEDQKMQSGLPMKESPKYLIFHPSQTAAVDKVLKASGEPDTAYLNNPNSLKRFGLVPIECRFLSPNYWFVAGEYFPESLLFLWRLRNKKTTQYDVDRRATKIMTVQRWGWGLTNWQNIFGNPGA